MNLGENIPSHASEARWRIFMEKAIFVENTLEYARSNDEKRNAMAYKEHVRVAQKLRQLVLQICTAASLSRHVSSKSRNEDRFDSEAGLQGSIKALKTFFIKSERISESNPSSHISETNMHVSREEFQDALQDRKVQQLLDEMDISITSRDKLFEILDADGNGTVAVSEMAEGFLRLRGPADKGDIVKSSLMIRSLQKSFQAFEVAVLRSQQELKNFELNFLHSQESAFLRSQQALVSRLDTVEEALLSKDAHQSFRQKLALTFQRVSL